MVTDFFPYFKDFFFFFDVDLLSFYWVCYNIASILCFAFLSKRHVGS